MKVGAKAFMVCMSVAVLCATVSGQAGRKPGLYEVTSTMTWQQSPFPPGMQLPPQAAAAFGGGPHTSEMCLTQEMIDRYGAPMPQSRGECTVTNIQKSPEGMTADLVCTGRAMGKGRVESHWSLDGTAKSKVHFSGTMQAGPNPTPIEWTMESTSVYKGSDCGDVKPLQLPKQQ